ncbi:acetyl-CoA synthetase-like protein [Desarmillaria tabescens]|uniref:Acetyl-CoA synthetase-like protein n=1 Tax=Armillaria tabescens TaxID=1929756 RepID=A0AA39NA50_ARMTA|nr:acetyl-CoA synthetase-like protein [Desarmillaria tabescens]KAK0461857.1 acetyl-CoA synthetase-like protein [Desarmillaria tabescens]
MSFSEHRVIPPPPQKQGQQSRTFLPPPIDGSLIVQQMFDWHLQHSPNHRVFVYAREDGSLRNISWAEAVAAAYTCARLMNNRIPLKDNPPVVAILSMSDTITYATTVMGLQRTNYVVFPISPRNSALAVAHLLYEVRVEHVLVGRDESMQVLSHEALDILKSRYPSVDLPQLSPIPIFEDLFLADWETRTNADDLPLLSVDPGAACMYLHSSGSTAYPKPIPWTCHRIIEHALVPWFGGRDLCDVVFAVQSLPMYHALGLGAVLWAASSGIVLSVFEPRMPVISPTLDNMFASAMAMNSDFVFCVPSFIEALSREPEYIDWLSTRSGVIYSGGPLSKEAGDLLTSRGVPVFVLYGTTECGIVTPILPTNASDCWDYFEFTKLATQKMVAHGPDLFEFVAAKNEFSEPSIINTTVDGVDGFATSDLFTPHPTKPGYWKIIGRIDDQILKLICASRTNPGPLENILNQDPHVSAAIMFGRGKYQVGILVEPAPQFSFDPVDENKLAEFRNLIWPTVIKVNQFAPQHSRLFKEMIIVTKPGRPFMYTAKNTVRRQAILNDYSTEIATLYETVEDSAQAGIFLPLEWDDTSTLEFVRKVVLQTLPHPIPDNEGLFQYGCDSLQATRIRNILFQALRDSANIDTRQISDDFIYSNPSTTQLAKYLVSVVQGALIPSGGAASRVDAMHKMVQKYSTNFPTISAGQYHAPTPEVGKIVLVTGTTGDLGCHILANLVLDETVKHIYAVNRPGAVPVMKRQEQTFADHGLDVNMEKVTMLEADLSVETRIIHPLTHIIHNAWPVNFNLNLSSFESNIRGLRKLIDLALVTPARLIYTSSIGVFQNAPEDHPLAEVPVSATVAQGTGYGESKWVSEELRLTPSLRYLIVRVGQLTGGPKGTWKINEWVPSMIQGSTVLGCLPVDDKFISWLPVHVAAQLLVDRIDIPTSILHLVHPKPVTWSTLARILSDELNVKLVSCKHWLQVLEHSAFDMTTLPAKRMLPHYKNSAKNIGLRNREAFGLPQLSTTSVQDARIPELDENEVRNWVQYWRGTKMLN